MADARLDPERTRRVSAHPRHALRCPVRVSGIDPEIDPETRLPCFVSIEESSVNLSAGGVFVPGADTLTPGRRVLVEIDLPSGTTLQASGAVAWRRRPVAARAGDRPAGMGIAFTGMSDASAVALADALETRRKPRGTRSQSRRIRHVHSA
jgi:Tfp pilus assembly protein PilZ